MLRSGAIDGEESRRRTFPMKLVRFGEVDRERPGVIDADGRIRDLTGVIDDITGLKGLNAASLPLVDAGVRIGACVGNVRNFYGIGRNYADHAAETNAALPSEPPIFNKATSCIAGPNDDVVIPNGAKRADWEVELAAVIGTAAYNVPEEKALDYVAGYCVCNDLSERAWQTEGTGQGVKGKSAPTFGPLGPWLVTADEVGDPQSLSLFLEVNGERVQSSSTKYMVFSVRHIVAYASRFMRLLPGDVIATGTPSGVGFTMKPPRYLKAGDVMHLGVEKLGEQRQTCIAYAG
jgi:2-keto-4-pentenoate hydratase/2-oxohepta-3-ene-1,7-dioic acid hydratase in catechol pathway